MFCFWFRIYSCVSRANCDFLFHCSGWKALCTRMLFLVVWFAWFCFPKWQYSASIAIAISFFVYERVTWIYLLNCGNDHLGFYQCIAWKLRHRHPNRILSAFMQFSLVAKLHVQKFCSSVLFFVFRHIRFVCVLCVNLEDVCGYLCFSIVICCCLF